MSLPNVPQIANLTQKEVPTSHSNLSLEDIGDNFSDTTKPISQRATHKNETVGNSRECLLHPCDKTYVGSNIRKSVNESLLSAFENPRDDKKIVESLRKHAADNHVSSDIYPECSKHSLPLSTACALNFPPYVISKLLETDPEKRLIEKDQDGWLPMQWAARCAYVDVMKVLFESMAKNKMEADIKPDSLSLLQIAVEYNLDNELIQFLVEKNPGSVYTSLSVINRCLKIVQFKSKDHCKSLIDECKHQHPLHACLLLSAGLMQCVRNEESQNPEQAEEDTKKAEKIEQFAYVMAQYCCDSGPLKDKDSQNWKNMDQLFSLAAELKLKFFVSQYMFTSRIWRLWYQPKGLKGDYSDYATIVKVLFDYTPSSRFFISSMLEKFPGFSMFLHRKNRRYVLMQVFSLMFLWVLWLYPLIVTSPTYSDSVHIVATVSVCATLLILPIEDSQIPACMRFTEHCISYMVFLILASTLPVQVGPGDLQPREIVIGYWLADICFSELIQWYGICQKQKYSQSTRHGRSNYGAAIEPFFFGSWKYLSDPWNVYDFISLYTAIAAGLARIFVYAGYENSYFTARESNTLYAFAIALLWGRLVKILTIFTLTGPLLIMVFTMIAKDLMQFCFLVILLELPFVSALSYLESVDGGNTDFATFRAASLSFFKVLIDNGAPEISSVSVYSAILYSVGIVLLVVLLLNLLVALFGQTFEDISKKALLEYLLQMTSLTHEWVRAPILPPPCTFVLQIRNTFLKTCLEKNQSETCLENNQSRPDSFFSRYTSSSDDTATPVFDRNHFESIAGELPGKQNDWGTRMLQNLEKLTQEKMESDFSKQFQKMLSQYKNSQ
jgi:hypothetical protein